MKNNNLKIQFYFTEELKLANAKCNDIVMMLPPETPVLITRLLVGVFKCPTDLSKYKDIQILFCFVPVIKIVLCFKNWFLQRMLIGLLRCFVVCFLFFI